LGVSLDDAEVSKNFIEHKERAKDLTIETINIKQLGY
jgi:hypothetical protein